MSDMKVEEPALKAARYQEYAVYGLYTDNSEKALAYAVLALALEVRALREQQELKI